MCRLSLYNKKAMEFLGKEGMLDFLNHLEKENGGHGNGVSLIKNGKCLGVAKGVKLTNQAIVTAVYGDELPDWFIYHTRIASKGSIKDSNCHPYTNKKKDFVLCMNGTVGQFGDLAKSLDITDTELVFKNLETFNIPNINLTELSPKFIGFRDGKVFATNPSVGGLRYDDTDGKLIIASSFPKGYAGSNKEMESSLLWTEGDALKERVVKVYSPSSQKSWYTGGYYGNVYSGDEWWENYYAKQEERQKEEDKQEELLVQSYPYTELELLDIVDEYNDLLKEGTTKEAITAYLEQEFGSDLSVVINESTYTFVVKKDKVSLLNHLMETIY